MIGHHINARDDLMSDHNEDDDDCDSLIENQSDDADLDGKSSLDFEKK